MMYWDILYNTDSDQVPYNDSFKHSSWLTMMKNRIEVARRLISDDGCFWIQCSDVETSYLKVLCDEIFNRNNYINTISVKTKIAGVSGSSEGKSLIDATEYILVYAKNKASDYFEFNSVKTKTPLYDLVLQYREEQRSWKYTTVVLDLGEKELIKEDTNKNYKYYKYPSAKFVGLKEFMKTNNLKEEEVYTKHYDKIIRTTNAQSSVRKDVLSETKDVDSDVVSIVYTPIKGKNKDKITEVFYKGPQREMFMWLSDSVYEIKGKPYYLSRVSTLWDDIEYNNLSKEGGVNLPFGKKPEKIIERMISLSTNKEDIVLDAYFGTGTTGAVALKMNRRFIGIEQLDSHFDLAMQRLNNVISGDNTGISSEYDWKGGGSFVVCELKKANQQHIDNILKINSKDEAIKYLSFLLENPLVLNYKIDLPFLKTVGADEFSNLSLDDMKRVLIALLEKNNLYVSYSDVSDVNFEISESEKTFSGSFYQLEK